MAGCDRKPAASNDEPDTDVAAVLEHLTENPPEHSAGQSVERLEKPSSADTQIEDPSADVDQVAAAAVPSPSAAMVPSEQVTGDLEPDPDSISIGGPSDDSESIAASADAVDSVEDATEDAAEGSRGKQSDRMRMFVPTTSGPLIVDADIRIGNQPLASAFVRRVESIIEEAAGDSELTWDALFDHVAANPNVFGGNPINEGQYKNMLRLYDKNRNKKPEYNEVVKFLFRDSRIAAPFRLVGSDFYRQINRMQSAMFMALDEDDSHRLDQLEIEGAHESLSRLDHNGDQRIDFAEVDSELRDDDRAWSNRRVSRRGEVAMDLIGYIDWQMLSYALDVSPRQGVFGEPENVIARLDKNGDDTIDAGEAKTLLSAPADVTLRVEFPVLASGESPRVEIIHLSPEFESIVQRHQSNGVISIKGRNLRLIAVASDLRGGRNQIPPEAFAALDADRDGGLDESEIPAPALQEYSFDDLDSDGDGKLTLKEINEGMAPKAPIWNVQVRARGAEAPDGIFSWLDENLDRTLSTRELHGVGARLRAMAGDGTLQPTDIPDSFVLHFGRGQPNRDEEIFSTLPKLSVENSKAWPRWAQSMDINRDGDISWEEFPGTREQFGEMDANHDGFIDSDEIR